MDGTYVLKLIVDDGLVSSLEDAITINSYSDYSQLFSVSTSSSGVQVGNYWQAGSVFSATIKNNSTGPFICYRAEFYSGIDLITFTEDASLLGGDEIVLGESVGIQVTLSLPMVDNGMKMVFYLTRPDTGENFTVTGNFNTSFF